MTINEIYQRTIIPIIEEPIRETPPVMTPNNDDNQGGLPQPEPNNEPEPQENNGNPLGGDTILFVWLYFST